MSKTLLERLKNQVGKDVKLLLHGAEVGGKLIAVNADTCELEAPIVTKTQGRLSTTQKIETMVHTIELNEIVGFTILKDSK
jgi:hypothetical protein